MTDEARVKAIALIKKLDNLIMSSRKHGVPLTPEQENAKVRILELMEKHGITQEEMDAVAEEPDVPPDKWDWGVLLAQVGITPEELESMSEMRVENFLVSTGWFDKKTDTTSTIASGVVKAGKVGADRIVQRFFSRIPKNDD